LKNQFENFHRKNFTKVTDPRLPQELLDFEQKQIISKFKLGVLYYKDGQVDEDEMFSNCDEDSSEAFQEFLPILGEKIELKDWDKFSGDLDTKCGNTGKYSIYTAWKEYEIMYHVSTMLKHNDWDAQQLEKKRFIGNDVVVIIFHDGTTPLSPTCLTSHYNHIFIVVRPEGDSNSNNNNGTSAIPHDTSNHSLYSNINSNNSKTSQNCKFRVGIAVKDNIQEYYPDLPANHLFDNATDLQNFLLSESISSIRAAMKSPNLFQKKIRGMRDLSLNDLCEKYA